MVASLSPAALVRAFYDPRRRQDPELLRPLLAPDVRWCEPDIGRSGVLGQADAGLTTPTYSSGPGNFLAPSLLIAIRRVA